MIASPEQLQRALELPLDRRAATAAEIADRLVVGGGLVHVVGAQGCAASLVGRASAERSARPIVYVTADLETAVRAVDDLSFATRSLEPRVDVPAPLLFTPSETNPYAEVHPERRATLGRLATLFRLTQGAWRFLVLPASALVRRVAPRAAVAGAAEHIVAEGEIDLARLIERLSRAGYLRTPVVEDPGSFAVRGGLVDVWPPGADAPIRAELYGDLVMSLKAFDPETQRTDAPPIAEAWLPPAREAILDAEVVERARLVMRSLCDAVNFPSTKTRRLVDDIATARVFFGIEGYLPAYYPLEPLWSYLPEDALVFVEEPTRVVRAIGDELEAARAAEAERLDAPHFDVSALYVDREHLGQWVTARSCLLAHRTGIAGPPSGELEALEAVPLDAPTLATTDQSDLEREVTGARSLQGRHGGLEPLVKRLKAWSDAGLRTVITARTEVQAERVTHLLEHRQVALGPSGLALVQVGPLARGIIAPTERLALVTEEEVFGHRARPAPARRKGVRGLLEDLRALEPGDIVVHIEHGIGRYLGLSRRVVAGASVELLEVEYAGGDKLYLPVYRLNQVQKYSGGEGAPRLDRLGGQSFAKTKARVQRHVREMADELLRLYAERAALQKTPLEPPDDEYAALEATFPFEETPDQAGAIADVNRDLEREAVMDRLVCGDVGFGKTEVAVRAALRNALAGRQTALLCPTTVLAQQHFLTFKRRLSDHGVEIRMLSRFVPKRAQEDTIRGLRAGTVDIVIGTHRLLSKDVHFKDLGLLVVDEEQRFGVVHKERIKQLRRSVDVLTLTATPIPRTLQLAVGGLRDMSIITTPPVDRRAIRTITSQFDEALVRDAVERELGRGGQIFYVYNRVEGIYERAARLQSLVPSARVAVGHGQLRENVLERTMLDFVAGKYDVLVATAIIESGLDIPRANTMIVDRADLFGLAQLYQLRGRVGRSAERAYCYLLVPPPSEMTDEARTRIEALERYSELGTGFHIATLDMEQRGAGNLLGADQSGFVASVGFDLFCQMLEEATHELRGEPVVHDVDPELTFDVDALLPDDYVPEVGVRLSLYKRLASALDEPEVAAIAAELEDRFGPPPREARSLIELMRIKTELRRLRVLGCEASDQSVTLHLREDTPLDPVKVGALVAARRAAYRLTPDMRLSRKRVEGERVSDGLALADKMLAELAGCVRGG